MCKQWTHVLYSVVITLQSNSPSSQFNSLCNEFTSVWPMFVTIFVINACVCTVGNQSTWRKPTC